MLSRYGTTQLPRRYNCNVQPKHKGDQTLCSFCVADVFGPSTYNGLLTAVGERSSTLRFASSYSRVSSDIYRGTVDGCLWCTVLANALLSSAELDYWYYAWQDSHTDGESMLDDEEDPERSDGISQDEEQDESMEPREPAAGDEELEADKPRSVDSSHFESSHSSRRRDQPGFLILEDLDCDAEIQVDMTFVATQNANFFNSLKVRLEFAGPNPRDPDCAISGLVGDDAVDLSFEVISPGSTSRLFPSEWGNVSPTSPTWPALARTWMSACNSSHQSCKPTRSLQPTRLIDVTDPDGARLILTTPGELRPYAALSYVWGVDQAYKLTKDTLKEKQRHIDMTLLSRTIKDAITVTRQLNLGYLWVDALCIIQDSKDDKARELPLMGDIYRNSAVTIIAASAPSANEGFLHPSESPRFFAQPIDIPLLGPRGEREIIRLAYRKYYLPSADPANSRAWCLQERVLSTRVVSFSYDGLKWMCREMHINPSAAEEAPRPFQILAPLAAESESGPDEDVILALWYRIRNDYSGRKLTNATDKLPAISAVAAEVARLTGWTYLAGMWREKLLSELHWECEKKRDYVPPIIQDVDASGNPPSEPDPDPAKTKYIAPSWSWCSIASESAAVLDDDMQERQPFQFEILQCQVEPVNRGFPFGEVKSGFLEVKGLAVDLTWELHDLEEGNPGNSDVRLVDGEGDSRYIIGEGVLDARPDVPIRKGKIKCLAMSTTKVGARKGSLVDGLLLQPHGEDGEFHRVGKFQMYGPTVFEGVSAEVYRIV